MQQFGLFVLIMILVGTPLMVHANEVAATTQEAGEVHNKICPISGADVGSMGSGIKVSHNGKTYNLCCEGCLEDFNKDPDAYVKKIEEQMKQGG